MASSRPHPPIESQRKDSNYDRERRRDGGKGELQGNLQSDKATTSGGTGERRSTSGREGKRREGEAEEDRIGPYIIGEEVGRGSFATVFKGARYVRPSTPCLSQQNSLDIRSPC